MNAGIALKEDIKQLAHFLVKCSGNNTQKIGYVGDNEEGIITTLQEDFLITEEELAFAIMKDDRQNIIGAIGLDIDDNTAEVWEPGVFGWKVIEQ